MSTEIPKIALPSGEKVPLLGQGTWKIGEDRRCRKDEAAALRLGLDLGLCLIDTAEMYGRAGGSEEVVGEAMEGRRDEVFLVTKVLPKNAGRDRMRASCEASLRRLRTDRADLYLLHWREDLPLEETLAGFQDLLKAGMIRYWGVSNFTLADMQELVGLPGGSGAATNQVLYNPARRGLEWDLLPWCRERRIPLMAYSPLDQGALRDHAALKKIAARHRATPAQLAVAWLARKDVIVIPKAARPAHIRENREALDLRLTAEDLEQLDAVFPPPRGPVPLETV